MSTASNFIAAGGGFSNIHTDTSSGSFALPDKITTIAIACTAGGGGSGGLNPGNYSPGGGNGGCGFFDTFLVPAGTTVHYVIGAGGAAGSNAGGDGGHSYVWLVDSVGNKRMAGGVRGGFGASSPGPNGSFQPPVVNVNENTSNGLNPNIFIGGRGGAGNAYSNAAPGSPVTGRCGGSEVLDANSYAFSLAGQGDLYAAGGLASGGRGGGGGGGSSMFAIGGIGGTAGGGGAGVRGSGAGAFGGNVGGGSPGGAGYIEIYY